MQVAPPAVMLTGRKHIREVINIRMGDTLIGHQSYVKYLDVYFDRNLSFGVHLRMIVQKPNKMVNTLRKLDPRLQGSAEAKLRLLVTMVTSTIPTL